MSLNIASPGTSQMLERFSQYVDKYRDRPFVVVGGGPSAALHVDEWPEDAVVIGTNEHALKLGVDHEFIVAVDDIFETKIRPELKGGARPKVISETGTCDIQLTEYFRAGNSGIVGAWCAHMMGALPVILTGMDCYRGDRYFWGGNDQPREGIAGMTEDYHVLAWRRLEQIECKGIQIRLLGSESLAGYYPRFRKAEQVERPDQYEPPAIEDINGVLVRFTAGTGVRGRAYQKDREAYLSKEDAAAVIQSQKAVEVRA